VELQNLGTVEEAYAAFARNDIPALLDLLADDVDWLMPGPPSFLLYAGPRRGRRQVAAYFEALNEAEEIELFKANDFIEGEDKVIVLGSYRARARATGRVISLQWVHVLTLCGGKIDRLHGYFDTAAVVAAHNLTGAQKSASGRAPLPGWEVARFL